MDRVKQFPNLFLFHRLPRHKASVELPLSNKSECVTLTKKTPRLVQRLIQGLRGFAYMAGPCFAKLPSWSIFDYAKKMRRYSCASLTCPMLR